MGTSGPHILVVEDEPVIASLLADVLCAGGYRVTQCDRVDAALAALRRTDDFALCISDFLLPDRTGLDLARALRELRPSLRMVLASAFLEPEIEASIQAEPAVAWIVRKPLDIFELTARVDALTGHASRTAPAPAAAPEPAKIAAPRREGDVATPEASC